jgi:hypothetical protein
MGQDQRHPHEHVPVSEESSPAEKANKNHVEIREIVDI